MMIPFMGAQSLVIGKQFGEGFQYGKRKISAMSNEEFNKVTPAKLAQNNAEELKEMIPEMKSSITDMRSFQSFIVNELIATAKQLPNDIFGVGTEGRNIVETQFGLRGALGISDEGFIADLKKFYENQIKDETFGTSLAATGGNQQFNPQQTSTRNFSYLKQVTLGSLQTQLLKRKGTDIELEQAIFKEIQRRIALDPNILNPPRKQTTKSAIEESGATGLTKFIATNINNFKIYLANQRKGNMPAAQKALSIKYFLRDAKIYNARMQQNRKYSFVVDTSKSISARALVFKTSR